MHAIKKLTAVLLLTYSCCSAQSFQALRDSVDKYERAGDSTQAYVFLTERIRQSPNHPYHNELYEAAALASSLNKIDSAYPFLDHLLAENEFDMITCDANADPAFANIRTQPRWGKMMGSIFERKSKMEVEHRASAAISQGHLDHLLGFSDSVFNSKNFESLSAQQTYRILETYSEYPKASLFSSTHPELLPVKINDSIVSFYSVWIPSEYKEKVPNRLMFVLHGAVYQNLGFPDPIEMEHHLDADTADMNRYFYQLGEETHSIVVFPHGNRQFNWMSPDDGFAMVPLILKDLKRILNIDDDRVYLFGHSNGATGVISYLIKNPTQFAGFYGFNASPVVRTGGTYLMNAKNRSYRNISTDKDYYFPLSAHVLLSQIADSLGIDWKNSIYKGYPHWFPMFTASKPAFMLCAEDMNHRIRRDFPNHISWQCDDVKYGTCDWLSIDRLDTMQADNAPKYLVKFAASHWIDNVDTAKFSDTTIYPFRYPRKSGTADGVYANNQFTVTTKDVDRISLLISPKMVDLTKPVKVVWNGMVRFNKKISYNKIYQLNQFKEKFDRRERWVGKIDLAL